MCGIAGKFNYEKIVDYELIDRMTDTLVHRGPDDKGVWVKDNFGFGMRRLSIIDIKFGHQPIFNQDESLGIVFNGEIYNFQEIRLELQNIGYKFKTNGDTETILILYKAFGIDGFNKLNGMFAFAIWDNNKKELLLVRDRIGVKPLYYYKDNNGLSFGSEIKSILEDKSIPREIDDIGLNLYFDLMYIPNPYSIFQNIKKLEPGHYLIVTKSDFKIGKYWQFDPSNVEICHDKNALIDEFLFLFNDSVKKRMISEVPLGAFLSGGIDSSAIVAFMAKNSDKRIKTFSIGFNDKHHDESQYAKQISELYNTEHTNLYVDSSMLKWIEDYVYFFDEPFADPAAFPTYVVSKLAKNDLTVVLTGDGGDEIFAGYNRYKSEKISDIMKYCPRNIRKIIISPFLELFKNNTNPDKRLYPMINAVLKRFNELDKSDSTRYVERFSKFSKIDRKEYINSEFDTSYILNKYYKILNSKLKSRLLFDQSTSLNEDMLTKVDRVTMANSLEARVPFLDYRIVEFTYKIPDVFLMHGFMTKSFLKDAYKNILPHNILNRSKHGFSSPIDKWIRYDLKEIVDDTLLSVNSYKNPHLNYNNIVKLINDHYSKKSNNGEKIFMLMIYQLWYNKWIN